MGNVFTLPQTPSTLIVRYYAGRTYYGYALNSSNSLFAGIQTSDNIKGELWVQPNLIYPEWRWNNNYGEYGSSNSGTVTDTYGDIDFYVIKYIYPSEQQSSVFPEGLEPFTSFEEGISYIFGDMVTKWNIRYVPINCSLTGVTSVNSNTQVDVTVTPYPQAQLVGTSVYYSGGEIPHTLTDNVLTFTTPSITEPEE